MMKDISFKAIVFRARFALQQCTSTRYVAVRIAKKAPYVHAGILGVINVVVGIAFASSFPLWFDVVSFIVVIPTTADS